MFGRWDVSTLSSKKMSFCCPLKTRLSFHLKKCIFWGKEKTIFFRIAQALRVALLRAPPNTFFEDTFMWSGEDAFRAAEFPSATELPREDVFRRHFTRSRISPRHRITSRRRFSKTLFPQPNFSPPPNCPPKTLFEDTFPAAEFTPATELSLPR